MKIQLVSDLHMEFAPIEITNAGADILVLSGDIIVADYFARGTASPLYLKGRRWVEWFERTCAQFGRVYYVLGNHEHYKGNFYSTTELLRSTLGHISNLYILDSDADMCAGFLIYGTTLWTDFDRGSYAAKLSVKDSLNDYRLIQGHEYRKLQPHDTEFYHHEAKRDITRLASGEGLPMLVFGHHAPSYRSIEERYRGAGMINHGYASDLERFIADHPRIKLWTHGHVHSSHDYHIADTRIVANPRGYDQGMGAENKRFNPNLVIDV